MRTTLNDIQFAYQKQAERLQNLSANTRVLEEENNRLQSVLGGYKDREEIVVKKPKLIQRRANDAVVKLMREYERATCSDKGCGKDSN